MPSEGTALANLARATGRQFESSPTGRWICFGSAASSGAVYVVQLPWSEGCAVWGGAEGEIVPLRYRDAQEAMAAAVRLAASVPHSEAPLAV